MEQQERIDQLEAENQELLALTKQAFMKHEVEKESVPVDEEWEKFAAEHADELESLEKDKPHTATIKASIKREQNDACINYAEREKARPKGKKLMGIVPYKVAASIIGILFTAGVAFAAIHIVRHVAGGDSKASAPETEAPNSHQPIVAADTIKSDTIVMATPVVFDNVTLDSIARDIAAYHHVGVDLQNEQARQLRFYFVWKQDDSLQEVIEKLNMFEHVDMAVEDGKLIVR